MANNDTKDLSGVEKATILLMAMGTNASAQILKHLSEAEIERLSSEIVKMEKVEPDLVKTVFSELEETYSATGGNVAGKEFASQLLSQVVGTDKANELIQKANKPSAGSGRKFESLRQAEGDRIAALLKEEHPQIIALVLVNLPREKAAAVLAHFDEETQAHIAVAICSIDEVDPEFIGALEEALHTKLETASAKSSVAAGPKTLVEILNNAERSTEKNILDALNKDEPTVGEQVRGMMFIYEDLVKLEDRSIQTVLREVDQEDLRAALKGSDDKVKELIFKNMSERAAETLKEDLELAGTIKVKDIEAAQQRMVSVVRRLLQSGEIALAEVEEEQVA